MEGRKEWSSHLFIYILQAVLPGALRFDVDRIKLRIKSTHSCYSLFSHLFHFLQTVRNCTHGPAGWLFEQNEYERLFFRIDTYRDAHLFLRLFNSYVYTTQYRESFVSMYYFVRHRILIKYYYVYIRPDVLSFRLNSISQRASHNSYPIFFSLLSLSLSSGGRPTGCERVRFVSRVSGYRPTCLWLRGLRLWLDWEWLNCPIRLMNQLLYRSHGGAMIALDGRKIYTYLEM